MAWREVFRRLRDATGKREALYQVVYAPVFTRQDWKGTVFARRTRGEGVPVEVWYLAEYFLPAWHDWQGLRDRCLRYFGQPEDRFPRKWATLNARCMTLADGMLHDLRLDNIVAQSWTLGPAARAVEGREQPSARAVYHEAVQNHRRIGLLVTAASWGDLRPRSEDSGSSQPVICHPVHRLSS